MKTKLTNNILDTMTAEAIDAIGTVWTKKGSRLYLSDDFKLAALGLEVETYKGGAISHAKQHGEKISNSKATKLIESCRRAWVDLENGALMDVTRDEAEDLIAKAVDAAAPAEAEEAEETEETEASQATEDTAPTDAERAGKTHLTASTDAGKMEALGRRWTKKGDRLYLSDSFKYGAIDVTPRFYQWFEGVYPISMHEARKIEAQMDRMYVDLETGELVTRDNCPVEYIAQVAHAVNCAIA